MMVQKDNITPEERLLKIIESPVGEILKRRPQAAAKRDAGVLFSVDKLIAGFKGIRVNKDAFKNIDLAVVNKATICVCGLLTFFWLFISIRDGFALRARFDKIKTGSTASTTGADLSPDIDINISGLLAAAKNRNIFALSAVPQVFQKTRQLGAAAIGAAVTTPDIKLVGIIWSDSPQVMIEDVKNQKTYLLSSGESVGDFKVKEILQNKVIVINQGQEMELR